MSGIPQFNYPAFLDAAKALREEGYEVHCPAEMDTPEVQAAALASTTGNLSDLASTGETWGDMLAADVKLIADGVDAIVLLPGWENSRGARLEAFVCLTVEKPVYLWIDGELAWPAPGNIVREIAARVIDQGDTSRYET